MSDETTIKEMLEPFSPEQATLAYSFLKGALPQVIAWMRRDGSASRTGQEWATILEEQIAAAEGYAREGR